MSYRGYNRTYHNASASRLCEERHDRKRLFIFGLAFPFFALFLLVCVGIHQFLLKNNITSAGYGLAAYLADYLICLYVFVLRDQITYRRCDILELTNALKSEGLDQYSISYYCREVRIRSRKKSGKLILQTLPIAFSALIAIIGIVGIIVCIETISKRKSFIPQLIPAVIAGIAYAAIAISMAIWFHEHRNDSDFKETSHYPKVSPKEKRKAGPIGFIHTFAMISVPLALVLMILTYIPINKNLIPFLVPAALTLYIISLICFLRHSMRPIKLLISLVAVICIVTSAYIRISFSNEQLSAFSFTRLWAGEYPIDYHIQYTSDSPVNSYVFIDVLSFDPVYRIEHIKTTNGMLTSRTYTKVVCECKTTNARHVWIVMTIDEYNQFIDPQAELRTNNSFYAPVKIFNEPVHLYGQVVPTSSINVGLTFDAGTQIMSIQRIQTPN